MVNNNAWQPIFDDNEEILQYIAWQDWYAIDSIKVIDRLSTIYKWRNTCRVHYLQLEPCQKECFCQPVLQQVDHLRATHVCRVWESINWTILSDALVDFGIHQFEQLFPAEIKYNSEQEVSGLVLLYDWILLQESIYIRLLNGLLNYCELLYSPTLVEYLKYNCQVEYTNARHEVMPASYDIGLQIVDGEVNYLNHTFQLHDPSFPVSQWHQTPQNQILHILKYLDSSNMILTFCKRCNKILQRIS